MSNSDATSVILGTCQTGLQFWLPAYYLAIVLANLQDVYLHSPGFITTQCRLCVRGLQVVT